MCFPNLFGLLLKVCCVIYTDWPEGHVETLLRAFMPGLGQGLHPDDDGVKKDFLHFSMLHSDSFSSGLVGVMFVWNAVIDVDLSPLAS